eukprot:540996-Prymnesium_polylepis.1
MLSRGRGKGRSGSGRAAQRIVEAGARRAGREPRAGAAQLSYQRGRKMSCTMRVGVPATTCECGILCRVRSIHNRMHDARDRRCVALH